MKVTLNVPFIPGQQVLFKVVNGNTLEKVPAIVKEIRVVDGCHLWYTVEYVDKTGTLRSVEDFPENIDSL